MENNQSSTTNNIHETRLSVVLDDPLVLEYIADYYKKEGKERYPTTAISRWKKGTHFPPVDVLIGIANVLDTNVAWLLGMTDVRCHFEFEKPCCEHTLDELLELRSMTAKELAATVAELNNTKTKNYNLTHSNEIPLKRVSSLMSLSKALDISIDYLLGLTEWETWEMYYKKMEAPFMDIQAGSGAYLLPDNSIQTRRQIREAIERGDGVFCLLSDDGTTVYFPNGNTLDVNDVLFAGSVVIKVKPEVD